MVQFIGALQHAKENGWYNESTGFGQPPPNILVVLNGRKEYVVVASAQIIEAIRSLPADSFLGHKMKDVKRYLDKQNTPYEVIGEASKI